MRVRVQVMAKEIFNPNLALFVCIPEGSSTYQPNPLAVIQTDGVNDFKDYFRFVGRFVGKALYDKQLLNAYFTRCASARRLASHTRCPAGFPVPQRPDPARLARTSVAMHHEI